MRVAITACAVALAIFAGIFGFLVVNNPSLIGNEPAAPAPPVSAENRPARQTVTVVTESPTVTVPAPVDASPTIAQRTAPAEAPAILAQTAPPPARAAAPPACAGNPDAIGVARTVEIDTTGGPGFGFEHFRQHDFLDPGRSPQIKYGEMSEWLKEHAWKAKWASDLKQLRGTLTHTRSST